MKKFVMVLFCLLFSCKSQNKVELHLKLEEYVNENFNSYSDIYKQFNSWILEAKKKRIDNVIELIFEPNYTVDKLILTNKSHTKLIGTVNISDSINKNVKHDSVFMFWGVKIENTWFFTRGGTLHVPRENYKYNIYKALHHFQLSYIGRDYFLKHFLNINGEHISVNSDLIEKHVSINDGYKYKEDSDENWLDFFNYKNAKIVSQKEIDDINESIKNEVEEEHILPEKGTKAYKELYGTKIPLFEREEWKAYEAQLQNTN